MTQQEVLNTASFRILVGEVCEFSDNIALLGRRAPTRLLGLDLTRPLAHFIDEHGQRWRYVRKYEEPKLRTKLWTAQTAPDNLMIRQSNWVEGTYCNADVGPTGVILQVYNDDLDACIAKHISWKELSEQFEQRDGSPCHEVKQVST